MGLLDSLFAQSTYGGQGGGLLDFLRNTQMQQDQYQPALGFGDQPNALDTAQWPAGPVGAPSSASFADRFNALPGAPQPVSPSGRSFDTAMFDPQTFAPNQAQPISVGSYQMPRVGNADQFNPQQAMLPPNATPTQGQLPAAAPQQAPMPMQQAQPQALPPALASAGSALSRIGSPDGLIARLTGNDTRSIARQNLKAQYDALVPIVGPQKAMLAVMNPEAGKTILAQALEKKQFGYHKMDDGTLVATDPTKPYAVNVYGSPGAKFEDVASLRKEVGSLPEVKRYAEAAPIFNSMIKSRDVNTAAADLDFVYGVAKIFDPESVVREGEMKLVGKAQSLPEDIKGMMGQVAMAKGRLTPEARQRILEVAQTRMNELRGAYDTRVNPYGNIAKRFNARPEDVLPSVPEMSPVGSLPTESPQATPQFQEGATATNPKTGQTITFRNGKWQ